MSQVSLSRNSLFSPCLSRARLSPLKMSSPGEARRSLVASRLAVGCTFTLDCLGSIIIADPPGTSSHCRLSPNCHGMACCSGMMTSSLDIHGIPMWAIQSSATRQALTGSGDWLCQFDISSFISSFMSGVGSFYADLISFCTTRTPPTNNIPCSWTWDAIVSIEIPSVTVISHSTQNRIHIVISYF